MEGMALALRFQAHRRNAVIREFAMHAFADEHERTILENLALQLRDACQTREKQLKRLREQVQNATTSHSETKHCLDSLFEERDRIKAGIADVLCRGDDKSRVFRATLEGSAQLRSLIAQIVFDEEHDQASQYQDSFGRHIEHGATLSDGPGYKQNKTLIGTSTEGPCSTPVSPPLREVGEANQLGSHGEKKHCQANLGNKDIARRSKSSDGTRSPMPPMPPPLLRKVRFNDRLEDSPREPFQPTQRPQHVRNPILRCRSPPPPQVAQEIEHLEYSSVSCADDRTSEEPPFDREATFDLLVVKASDVSGVAPLATPDAERSCTPPPNKPHAPASGSSSAQLACLVRSTAPSTVASQSLDSAVPISPGSASQPRHLPRSATPPGVAIATISPPELVLMAAATVPPPQLVCSTTSPGCMRQPPLAKVSSPSPPQGLRSASPKNPAGRGLTTSGAAGSAAAMPVQSQSSALHGQQSTSSMAAGSAQVNGAMQLGGLVSSNCQHATCTATPSTTSVAATSISGNGPPHGVAKMTGTPAPALAATAAMTAALCPPIMSATQAAPLPVPWRAPSIIATSMMASPPASCRQALSPTPRSPKGALAMQKPLASSWRRHPMQH
mmetsp:Transcript_6390/g.15806  ORF Transcript_6390/g.15806 Transcript_6390/m.15806 type:complete len:614 (-) Transcript_6390:5-1846(-)